MIGKESFEHTEKQSVKHETEENELLLQIERERIEKEKNELMKKQNQTLETEKNGSLLFQLEGKRKELQHISGNLQYLNYSFIRLLLLIIS